MPIQSLIFDFDGLILDTETPEVDVWQSIYAEHGLELPLDLWDQIIGGYGLSDFNAANHLTQLAGNGLDPLALRARHKSESDALILLQPVLPGVRTLLDEARRLDLHLGVASSSPHAWVDSHLARLGLLDRFDAIVCADDVPAGRTKPHPDLYLKALRNLNAAAEQAIALEDSPNGVKAARAAGMYVVAVPNPTTRRLPLDGADLKVDSLEAIALKELIHHG